jgi:beta-lactam-binding protein with PASTA domain/predicted Ser/Thr protein kinase
MSNDQPAPPRQRVGGRYELGELLGRGGMAEVRKGTDVRLGRVVAVKRLRTDLASDPTFQARFRREAQSSASLNHHSIVSVYDTGQEMSPDGVPQPYIVMEYVAGRTLRDILREGRKILPERALEITSGILAALDYSHRAGIVHRDIKPANVMLTPSGDVKVMDFGIARAISDSSSTMTQTAAVVGTAQYLSPEQARGESVDSRSDVYSTGCLLYELLTGRPPFVGESPVSVAYQHVREHAPPPSSLDPELPPEVDAIVMKALTKTVEDRYQSAAAMRADIERFLAGKPVVAPVVPVGGEGPPTGDAPTSLFEPVPARHEDVPERRKRWPLIVTLVTAVVLIALAAVLGPLLLNASPEEKTVPQVVNMPQAQAEARIKAAGLTVGTVSQAPSDDVTKGSVIAQDPDPLSTLTVGGGVDLTVSTGKPDVVVPYVIGDDKETARQKLLDAGLKVKLVRQTSDEDADTVIRTAPNPADSVSTGSLVTVYYSTGPTKVPNVTGLQERAARTKLEDAGFRVDAVTDTTTVAEKGTVLRQSPSASTAQPQGTTVVITVSGYETPSVSPTPTPTGSASPSGTPSPGVTTSPTPSAPR